MTGKYHYFLDNYAYLFKSLILISDRLDKETNFLLFRRYKSSILLIALLRKASVTLCLRFKIITHDFKKDTTKIELLGLPP